ncbi:alpha/beta hydrolase [Brevibacillus daliensis]|uniref:alpha/beta hydrolase n=1 Tax=Brevibacillus daliensis TaxID=2892995 RepID=UPI001E5EBF63|nr:alpha/beta hydrolase-fold protein [Brevibacillus daliensis]
MSDYLKRTINKELLESQYLESPRRIKVYLPPGYNEMVSYPVIYCQDGNEFFTMMRIATTANRLILDESMEPMIIVGVSNDLGKRTSEYSATGSRNKDYKKFFIEDLVPFIENKYPVRTDKENRILCGDSLSSTVSFHLALDRPDLFSKVISFSGAFFDASIEEATSRQDLSWLEMWMIVGLEETDVETHIGTYDFLSYNRRMKKVLEERTVSLSYQEAHGGHTWGFWQGVLPDAMRHFFPTNQ